LKLNFDELLSSFANKFKLRHYSTAHDWPDGEIDAGTPPGGSSDGTWQGGAG